MRESDKKQNELLTSTALWYGIKCVFLFVLTLHIPTCIWYGNTCLGRHNKTACNCSEHSWAARTWHDDELAGIAVYGRTTD